MNKFTTTHPTTGKTAKRGSENRFYTHAVWAGKTEAQERARLQADLERFIQWRQECRDAAEGHGPRYEQDLELAARFERHTARTPEDWLKAAAEEQVRIERTQAELATQNGDVWWCDGWCGRPDLAEKKAAGLHKKGFMVAISEAVQV